MKGGLKLRAVFHDPPLDGCVIDGYPTFLHQLFHMAIAQRIGDIPADPHKNDVLGEMCPGEADRHRLSPPLPHGLEGEIIPPMASNENLRQNRSNTMTEHTDLPAPPERLGDVESHLAYLKLSFIAAQYAALA